MLSFQHCCYASNEQLITVPSYQAGSALLYNPRRYSDQYRRYDHEPKQWCCLYSNNCHYYYRVRPLDHCFEYRFPPFGQYSLTVNNYY